MIRIASVLVGAALSLSCLVAGSLEWGSVGTHRRAKLPSVPSAPPGFSRVLPDQSGIRFSNVLSFQRKSVNPNLMNGSGVALGDYDDDGLCDLYLCDLSGTNKLYRNLGNWRFKDVTELSGTSCPKQSSTGAVFADVNGDRRLDLLVTSLGG